MRNRILVFPLLIAAAAVAQPLRIQIVTGGHNHDISFYEVFQGNKASDWAVEP